MSALAHSTHEESVHAVAERYRRDGYEVYEEPPQSAVPFDLGSYKPDAIARKQDRSLIIEVKSDIARTSVERLRSVVDEVRRHKGWQFVLITAGDVLTALPDFDGELFSWDDVTARIENAQRLGEEGQYEAAFIALWIALERTLRFQARQVSLPVDRLAPAVIIRQLYSQGELTMAQFDASIQCQEVRNRIVHGFPAGDLRTEFTRLGALVREVVEQWRSPVVQV